MGTPKLQKPPRDFHHAKWPTNLEYPLLPGYSGPRHGTENQLAVIKKQFVDLQACVMTCHAAHAAWQKMPFNAAIIFWTNTL